MKVYSYSKLSLFEQCKLKFKFKYIDKIKPEVEMSIEAHLGKTVHSALEWLYGEVMVKKIPSIEDVIKYYSDAWQDSFKEDFVVVKKELTSQDYFNKGVEFVLNYYTQNYPFDEETLEIEKKLQFFLDEEKKYSILGFIDRLVYNSKLGEYEIHDYKTASNLPSREKIDEDRQLALYSMGIKDLFGHDKKTCLIWHYLNFNKKICIRKTSEELAEVKKKVLELIDMIENTKDFPACKSVLCSWCEFKSICPEWRGEGERIKKEFQKGLDDYPTVKKYLRG